MDGQKLKMVFVFVSYFLINKNLKYLTISEIFFSALDLIKAEYNDDDIKNFYFF